MRTTGLQDFYNLVDVYLDAVLHPKCIDDPHTFAQEGWHYELEDPKVCPVNPAMQNPVPIVALPSFIK